MATKRPNTIGSNPLKTSTAKSLKVDQTSVVSSEQVVKKVSPARTPRTTRTLAPKKEKASEKISQAAVSETVTIAEDSPLPKQSPGIATRVRRSAKETEALFAEQLKRHDDEPEVITEHVAEEASKQAVAQDLSASDRQREAMAIVKTWSQWAVVAGMTPVPILDTLVLSGTQIKLIQLLCKHYNIPFEHKVAIAVATGLVGSTATSTIAGGITRVIMKNVPIVGQIFNWTVEPALSFGATYAIGATFVRHFEANGNLVSFKGEQMKEYAAEQFQKGKNLFLSKKHAAAA